MSHSIARWRCRAANAKAGNQEKRRSDPVGQSRTLGYASITIALFDEREPHDRMAGHLHHDNIPQYRHTTDGLSCRLSLECSVCETIWTVSRRRKHSTPQFILTHADNKRSLSSANERGPENLCFGVGREVRARSEKIHEHRRAAMARAARVTPRGLRSALRGAGRVRGKFPKR